MNSRAARLGLHICLALLLLISATLPAIPVDVLAESPDGIIIEEADWVGIAPLEPAPPMPDALPRVVVEYGSSIRHGDLEGTTALPDIPARTIVEYGGYIRKSSLEATTDLPDIPARIMVEYGGSIVRNDLQGATAMPDTSPRIIVTSAASIVHASLTPITEEPSPPVPLEYPLHHPWTDTLGFGQSWGSYYGHLGEDYAAPAGTPVYAVASGEVVLRHDDPYPGQMTGWGNALIISHQMPGDQTIYSQYAHFQTMLVNLGDAVEAGQQIGTIGQTGFATGPHLHLEIKDTAVLGPGYAGYSFTGDSRTHGGVTYYRPSTFIEQRRGLKNGDEMAVTGTGGAGLRLRSNPAISSDNILTVMPEGSQVTVVGGPTIAHRYAWWQVQFGEEQGWAAGRYLIKVEEGHLPPYVPTGLGQYTMDETPLPAEGEVRQDTIVLKGTMSHPDGSPVKLQVELRPVEEEFQGRFTRESGLVASGKEASVSISELSDGDYHWQARAMDATGLVSEMVSFGIGTEPDFSIRINRSPVALFHYRPTTPVLDEEIHFDALASYDWDEAIVSYEWGFGDGQIAFGEQVTHIYPETGDYVVTLTVTDSEGLQGEHSAKVRVFSKVLLDEINRLIDTAIDNLDSIESVARDLTKATDCFAHEVKGAPRGMAISGALSIISFAAGPVVPDIDLGNLGKIPAPVSIGAGADAVEWVTNQILDRLGEGEDFSTFFVPNLEARIEEHRVELENLRVELIENLPDLSEEEVELFVSDLRGRRLGNLFMAQQYWTKAHTVLTYRQLKQDDEESWTWIVGKNLWSWSLRLLDIAGSIATGGGLGAILVSGGLAIPEVSRGMWVALDQLDTDAQMMSISMAALTDGFIQADRIFENVGKGLENIREETLPIPVKGEIVSVDNVVEGHGGVFGFIRDLFSAREAYSQVRIENQGDAPAIYDLYATSYRTFSTVGLIPGLVERSYEIPFIWHTQEEIGEGLPPETITLEFLGEGGGQVPSGKVFVMLIGSNDDGVYGLEYRSTSFDTTYIDEDGEIIPEERARELQVRHYPVRSGVRYVPEADGFVLKLLVSNEFMTPLTAELYQQIPEEVEVISADWGTVCPNSIRWELQLEAGATKVLETTLTGVADNPFEIPAARYEIYDMISDSWLGFESDPVVLEIPLTVTTTELPGGNTGVAYETSLEAFGGTRPYTWNWTAEQEGQQLPPGLDLSHDTGVISGTPTEDGTFHFTVEVTDDQGLTALRDLSLNIMPAAVTEIMGEIREVNCASLTGVTVTLYLGDDEMGSTVSDEDAYYDLAVAELGEYTVIANKAGFREETQAVTVADPDTYTIDFVADHGLIPNAPNMSYVLACINLWQFGELPCKLAMSRVLAVINAWQFPVAEY